MKKLLSLPPNLVDCFHEITKYDRNEWFCTNDPVGRKLGSGGGTTWLLESCYAEQGGGRTFDEWLAADRRLILHAGGQSRRLPAYAPSGKVLTPVPVFRWERGQRLSQDLLSLQVPLYERIMGMAPDGMHTMIVSGDVYIRATQPLQPIPDADVVCYGLWLGPEIAKDHGVFVSKSDTPTVLECMMQKPSVKTLGALLKDHFYLTDIGVWLLSDRAVELLRRRSKRGADTVCYDLYGEFGCSLGTDPVIDDPELRSLSVAVLPLPGGEFYHFGTSGEMISSMLAIQNIVNDQREIMHHGRKPHPSIFIQNAITDIKMTGDNTNVWIENSHVSRGWKLSERHLVTGVPRNDWSLTLPAGVCVDVVPYGDTAYVARPYGFYDLFKGAKGEACWMGKRMDTWCEERQVSLADFLDIQDAPLFPVCASVDDLGILLRWMISEPELEVGKVLWKKIQKVSANQLLDNANLRRLLTQRKLFRKEDWKLLARNHARSVFYQLDLADAAEEFTRFGLEAPEALPIEEPLMKRIHNRALRARILRLEGKEDAQEQQMAFALLREGLTHMIETNKQMPRMQVYPDQIVWGRSPVRIDLAGGWTDTPPYCLFAGGNVVNVAIELNGQPPLQVYVKPSKAYQITLRSIDLGAMEVIRTWEELADFNKVGSPFSIPKAALALAGFLPRFSAEHFSSLEEQLKAFGCGLEITLLAVRVAC